MIKKSNKKNKYIIDLSNVIKGQKYAGEWGDPIELDTLLTKNR